jgi:hypothetical protein
MDAKKVLKAIAETNPGFLYEEEWCRCHGWQTQLRGNVPPTINDPDGSLKFHILQTGKEFRISGYITNPPESPPKNFITQEQLLSLLQELGVELSNLAPVPV